MHNKTGSELASELNCCFLSGFVCRTFLCLWSTGDSLPAVQTIRWHVDTRFSVRIAHLQFWITSIVGLFMHFTPLDGKGLEVSGQWVFNCLVSTFSLYPRHLTFQGQACVFESLSSAPVQCLSGCLRISFHSLRLIYRYTFLCVHVLGMAIIVENTVWACHF